MRSCSKAPQHNCCSQNHIKLQKKSERTCFTSGPYRYREAFIVFSSLMLHSTKRNVAGASTNSFGHRNRKGRPAPAKEWSVHTFDCSKRQTSPRSALTKVPSLGIIASWLEVLTWYVTVFNMSMLCGALLELSGCETSSEPFPEQSESLCAPSRAWLLWK